MNIGVVTIFPELVAEACRYGVLGKSIEGEYVSIRTYDPREYCSDPYRTVDDRPYGGGPGMVMKPGPLAAGIDLFRSEFAGPVIYLSPQGEKLNQEIVLDLADAPGFCLLCGRYEGIDERIIESRVDREISVGDYVVSGGELPALLLIDAVVRHVPGVLGNPESAGDESFTTGYLDHPQYTRPDVFEGRPVPPILLSGDHAAIKRWRHEQAYLRTRERRPDLMQNSSKNAKIDG